MSIQVSPESNPIAPSSAAADREAYLMGLLSRVSQPDSEQAWLDALRDRAQAFVREQTFPTTRDEEWRFTDPSGLLNTAFQPVQDRVAGSGYSTEALTLTEAAHSRLVFVNGRYAPERSDTAGLPDGVVIGNLATVQAHPTVQAQLEQYLGCQSGNNELFTALNTAGFQDAAIAWIPKNQILETPLHLVFLSAPDGQTIAHPRCLILAEANSALTVVEDYRGDAGTHLTNAVTEIWLGENAQVDHVRLQRDGAETFHIGKTAVAQARDSRYTCTAIATGAQLSRHNLEIFQTGEQTETNLYSLVSIKGHQVADTHSAIAYSRPHGTGNQIHKCIIDDRAHAVFNGKISVPHEAQLTNASQLNRNLLLSAKARVDTKPQLEIVADNVKCAHGATVSQLEADEVFYLQSRGVDQASAQRLLIYAFAQEIIHYVPIPSLQSTLTQQITGRQAV